jgi:DNA repair protein RadC
LTEVKGIGPAKAVEIKAALEIGRRLMTEAPEERPRVTSPGDAANLLMSEMMFLEQEHLRLILLDTRNRVISTPTVYVGSLNTSVVRIGELFRAAIKDNAAAFIVAHNHPSGDPSPSPEDVTVTRQIVQSGKLLDIELLDHVIIGRQRYVSLKERGLGFDA